MNSQHYKNTADWGLLKSSMQLAACRRMYFILVKTGLSALSTDKDFFDCPDEASKVVVDASVFMRFLFWG